MKFIRKEHGDFFGIGVAGYPEGHTQAMEKAKLDEDGKVTSAAALHCTALHCLGPAPATSRVQHGLAWPAPLLRACHRRPRLTRAADPPRRG